MVFLDFLNQTRWKHSDENVRLNSISGITNRKNLAQIIEKDNSEEVQEKTTDR